MLIRPSCALIGRTLSSSALVHADTTSIRFSPNTSVGVAKVSTTYTNLSVT